MTVCIDWGNPTQPAYSCLQIIGHHKAMEKLCALTSLTTQTARVQIDVANLQRIGAVRLSSIAARMR